MLIKFDHRSTDVVVFKDDNFDCENDDPIKPDDNDFETVSDADDLRAYIDRLIAEDPKYKLESINCGDWNDGNCGTFLLVVLSTSPKGPFNRRHYDCELQLLSTLNGHECFYVAKQRNGCCVCHDGFVTQNLDRYR